VLRGFGGAEFDKNDSLVGGCIKLGDGLNGKERVAPLPPRREEALADHAIYQGFRWWRGQDLNLRPSGYEPSQGGVGP
jgi:hypothetical protein